MIWHEAFYNPNHPELQEVLAYLDHIVADVGADMPDTVALDLSAQGEQAYATAATYPVRVPSFATAPREILLDSLDRRRYYAGQRVSADQGWSARDLLVEVPAPLLDPEGFYLTAKIVPIGAAWTGLLDEDLRPLPIMKDRVINLAQTTLELVPGHDFYLYSYYHARDERDLRVDLLDGAGRFIAGKVFPVPPGAGSLETSLPIPADIPSGQGFTLSVQILPHDAPWSACLDQQQLAVHSGPRENEPQSGLRP